MDEGEGSCVVVEHDDEVENEEKRGDEKRGDEKRGDEEKGDEEKGDEGKGDEEKDVEIFYEWIHGGWRKKRVMNGVGGEWVKFPKRGE